MVPPRPRRTHPEFDPSRHPAAEGSRASQVIRTPEAPAYEQSERMSRPEGSYSSALRSEAPPPRIPDTSSADVLAWSLRATQALQVEAARTETTVSDQGRRLAALEARLEKYRDSKVTDLTTQITVTETRSHEAAVRGKSSESEEARWRARFIVATALAIISALIGALWNTLTAVGKK